ncbi:hypothetical protein ACEPAF_2723 [Sanghuangporus sanghuang]
MCTAQYVHFGSRPALGPFHLSSYLTDFLALLPPSGGLSIYMSSTTNASNDNGSSNGDPWSYSRNTNQRSSRTRKIRVPKIAKHVPDAWDDDEDDEGEEEEKEVDMSRPRVDNRTLWNDANTRQPMPEVILRTSSTSASAAPPPEVLQQPMRILKRPSASSSVTSVNTTGSANGGTTLRDREAAYEAARARIFGRGQDGESGVGDAELRETQERLKAVALGLKAGSPAPSPSPNPFRTSSMTGVTTTPTTSILRDPHGPPSSSSSSTNGSTPPTSDTSTQMASRGFEKRRGSAGGSASGHGSGKTSKPSNTGSSSSASASSLKS